MVSTQGRQVGSQQIMQLFGLRLTDVSHITQTTHAAQNLSDLLKQHVMF